ncbi:MAG: type II toxin-antitoxin system RelE/ParE family toxin [Clostridia bacterium]|nr:type II toxin-antitoxin system RelE/ParE family toxin [Clostridia bacterium]
MLLWIRNILDKYSIYFSKEVSGELDEIYSYIALECMEPENARSVLEKIQETIRSLEEMPMRFNEQRRTTIKGKGIRKVSAKGFLIFYKVFPKQKKVTILAVRHESTIQ